MLPEQRRKLEERRRVLREARERDARLALIRGQTVRLEAAGVTYEICFDPMPEHKWLETAFPWAGSLTAQRIDWPKVPRRRKGPAAFADEEVSAWLGALVHEERLRDSRVTLVSGNGLDPTLQFGFADFRREPCVVSSFPEAWAFSMTDGWAFEYDSLRGGWWWGRAPASAA